MSWTTIMRRAAVIIALLALSVSSLPAGGEELTNPLTAEEVSCDELQLERMLQRMNAAKRGEYRPPELVKTLLLSRGESGGLYDGLVATGQLARMGGGGVGVEESFEHYLAFNLNPAIRRLLLNPDRPQLAQVSLNREDSNSNLVRPGGAFDVVLTLDPTLGGGDPLTINNFEVPERGRPYNGFLANSTKPGRGLITDGLLTPCHEKLTDFDRHVLSVLQRVARSDGLSEFLQPDMEVAIFRGEDPHVYRLNFYPVYEFLETRGRVAVELRISWDERGRLTTAVAQTHGVCAVEGQPGCTNLRQRSLEWYLIPPVFGGREYYDNGKVQNAGAFRLGGPDAPVTLDLAALLAGTTWNEPVW